MNGQEHYRMAEDLTHDARLILEKHAPSAPRDAALGASALASLAQVHATLALAAATAADRWVSPVRDYGGHDVVTGQGWTEVTR